MQAALSQPKIRVLGIGSDLLPDLLSCDKGVRQWHLDVAPDVESGAQKLVSSHYNVVLVELPESTEGETVIQQLRRLCPRANIILLVEKSTPQDVIDAIRSQAFACFSKPFDFSEVREMILSAATMPEPPDSIQLMSAIPDYLSLNVRCSVSTGDRLVHFMSEIPVELSDTDRIELGIAFREMLLNAIEHGAKLDPKQWVRVSRIRTNRTLVYHIQDPGEGFSRGRLDHAAVGHPNDPTAHVLVRQEKGMRAGGFGMLIVSRLVDEVIYNEQGNEVILIKYLD
jgi:anti-sigma regulatory factor (Ser/Thr protein kinase)